MKNTAKKLRSEVTKHFIPSPLAGEGRISTRSVSVRNSGEGFTLAEVLITLGIIGVVAAVTMPTLIKHYRHKTLETQFKKTYAELEQIINKSGYEFGACEIDGDNDYRQLQSYVLNSYKAVTKYPNHSDYYSKLKTYNLQQNSYAIHYNCFYNGTDVTRRILPNGAYLGLCKHNYRMFVTFDTNGPDKGPNAYGHDIFFFKYDDNKCKLAYVVNSNRSCTNDEINNGTCPNGSWVNSNGICKKTSTSGMNGVSCGFYALQNKCPDDPTKTYWECLP